MATPAPAHPTDTIYINYFDAIDDAKTKALMGHLFRHCGATATKGTLLSVFFRWRLSECLLAMARAG